MCQGHSPNELSNIWYTYRTCTLAVPTYGSTTMEAVGSVVDSYNSSLSSLGLPVICSLNIHWLPCCVYAINNSPGWWYGMYADPFILFNHRNCRNCTCTNHVLTVFCHFTHANTALRLYLMAMFYCTQSTPLAPPIPLYSLTHSLLLSIVHSDIYPCIFLFFCTLWHIEFCVLVPWEFMCDYAGVLCCYCFVSCCWVPLNNFLQILFRSLFLHILCLWGSGTENDDVGWHKDWLILTEDLNSCYLVYILWFLLFCIGHWLGWCFSVCHLIICVVKSVWCHLCGELKL